MISDFLADFLNKFNGITASCLVCNLSSKETEEDNSFSLKVKRKTKTTADFKIYKPKIAIAKKILDKLKLLVPSRSSRNETSSSTTETIFSVFPSKLTHVVVLISEKTTSHEVMYGYDPTNLFPIIKINQDITNPRLTL